MNKMLFVLLAITTSTVSAEVFKCKSSTGATEYRPTPCSAPGVQQAVVDIKPMNSQQEEQAQIRLQAWRDEQDANEKAKIKAEKERQTELDKQTELNALTRSATASEQQALAAQRLAGQIEHQNRINTYNSLYEPIHRYGQPNQGSATGYQNSGGAGNDADDSHRRRHGHEGRHQRRHDEQVQHQQQLGDYGVYRPEGSLGNATGE
ncbi:exported hypothetical protein [Crenothrix polyspora]|uniref:DUF4124 domain-containing protein n=1 Tax=Crenothrix polyspora TaxID=360316 RepID=A0A1R4H453_9GAMM|nr:hypothetical protein [Crenothrix polyspora]SJM90620.1 exported hypothetical protein [Crenothrix polyspora]